MPEQMNGRHVARHEYSAVRQVLQSEVTGEEIRPNEVVKGYSRRTNSLLSTLRKSKEQRSRLPTQSIYFTL
jgi:hypothetical protein